MTDLFTLENLFTLGVLILLQAVLGFDNLLYISLESKRVVPEQQQSVRRLGIGLAIVLRLVLLFLVVSVIKYFQNPFFELHLDNVIEASVNVHSIIVLAGGIFIIYTAVKEIAHMMNLEESDAEQEEKRSFGSAVFWIVIMNLIFSFDSILSSLALTKLFSLMAIATVIGGFLMIWLADHVTVFLQKNRMYEVLGLFILFIVGIMLLSEGGHLAHLHLLGYPVTPMTKTTFYFVIIVLIGTDLVQSRYQKKISRKKSS